MRDTEYATCQYRDIRAPPIVGWRRRQLEKRKRRGVSVVMTVSGEIDERTRLVSGPERERGTAVLRRSAVDGSRRPASDADEAGLRTAAGRRDQPRTRYQPCAAPNTDDSYVRSLDSGVGNYDDR